MRRRLLSPASLALTTLVLLLASPVPSLRAGGDCGEVAPPGDVDDSIRHAECLRKAGHPREALAEYEKARRLAPQCSRALDYGMGLAYEDLDLGEKAHGAFLKVRTCAPADADLLYHLGIAREVDGLFDEALVYFREALALDAGDNRVQRNIGFVLTRQGHNEVELADLETKLGEWAPAEKRYRQVLAADEDDVDAHMGLAIVYRHLQRLAESDTHLHRAIELRPDLKRVFEHAVESAP